MLPRPLFKRKELNSIRLKEGRLLSSLQHPFVVR